MWLEAEIQALDRIQNSKLKYLRDKMFQKANKSPTSSNKYLYRKVRNRVVAE